MCCENNVPLITPCEANELRQKLWIYLGFRAALSHMAASLATKYTETGTAKSLFLVGPTN